VLPPPPFSLPTLAISFYNIGMMEDQYVINEVESPYSLGWATNVQDSESLWNGPVIVVVVAAVTVVVVIVVVAIVAVVVVIVVPAIRIKTESFHY